jgi:hypothetical protein
MLMGPPRTAALRRAVKEEKSQFGALEGYIIVIARSRNALIINVI